MSTQGQTNPFEMFFDLAQAWMQAGTFAPHRLDQAILPGWSLISVNQGNSSAPDTEQAIVAKASYGRQLGRVMDALSVVIEAQPDAVKGTKAVEHFEDLYKEIEEAKIAAAKARIDRLTSDLELLEAKAGKEYAHQRKALQTFLDRHKGTQAEEGS